MKKKIEIPSLEKIQKERLKRRLEADLLKFLKWVFENIYKEEFIENWHHRIIAKILILVYSGGLIHVIINLPPRYTKTELVVKAFMAWCLAKESRSKFMHLSYSDDLALDNSSMVKEIILHDKFQEIWPLVLKNDAKSKKKWYTEDGGGVYATSTGGQITGFGAGGIGDEFRGAIIIDDPIKPEDANSDTIRSSINNRFNSTIKSRCNNPKKTPIIVIMQRVHEEDFTGFLLGGGSEFYWFHLNLPALNEDGPSVLDPRQKGEALWPRKHDEDQLEAMRISDAGTFAGQYQQRPAPEEGNIFKWFKTYKTLPPGNFYKVHSWDMSFKEKSKNKRGKVDFVVGTEWGKNRLTGDIYLFPDMVRARMGFPDTLEAIELFIERHPDFKALLIEDKANGSAIISTLKRSGVKRVIAVEPSGDKKERAESVAPLFKAGDIYLPDPAIAPWIEDFINELKVFPNGKNDDQVDSTTQALEFLDKIGNSGGMKSNKRTFSKQFERRRRDRKSRIKVNSY